MIRDKFLQEIEAFLRKHEMNATQFGRLALNDTNFVHRVRGGADIRLSTVEKVRSFMDKTDKDLSVERASV